MKYAKFLFSFFAISVLLTASCSSDTSDGLYDSIDRDKIKLKKSELIDRDKIKIHKTQQESIERGKIKIKKNS